MASNCIIQYIQYLSKDQRVRTRLTNYHNNIFDRIVASKLFRKWNDYYFLPISTSPDYSKAKNFIDSLNKEFGVKVAATSFTKANAKEYVFVNVKNLVEQASQEDVSQGTLFQKDQPQQRTASPATIAKLREWLNRANIKVEQLDTKRYGGINGVANLTDAIIQIAEGKENVALPEEAMHFLTEMIKQAQPGLYNQMLNRIGRMDVYGRTKEQYQSEPSYRNPDGTPNIIKLKEEAIGKALTQLYLNIAEESNTENVIQTKTWLDRIIEWIKGLLKANTNPFQQAIEQMDTINTAVNTDNSPNQIQIKEGVNEIFINSPELASIGSQKQYSAYLNTIFPDSSIKNIVYHGTTAKEFEQFDKNKQGSKNYLKEDYGFFFTSNKEIADSFSIEEQDPYGVYDIDLPDIVGRTLAAKLNVSNLKIYEETSERVDNKAQKVQNRGSSDGVEFTTGGFNEYIVFEPEQIHILGNKQDIEGFRNWVAQNSFLQLADRPADQLFKKFEDKISQYSLKKHEDKSDPDDENTNSYYTADINGETVKVDRTTEWAKRQNLRNTGGRDYFAGASDVEKRKWARKALTGTKGHYDLENIVNQAINEDGTLKPIEEVQLSLKPTTILPVYNTLVEFMIGTPGNPGFLYTQFPVGTQFRTEVQVFNEKAKSKVDGKELTGRAGTMDLVAVHPDGAVKVYDYKFMGFSLERNKDIPRNKRQQHSLQLGDYKRILKDAYGVENAEAFTIPIHAQYNEIEQDGETYPILMSVTIGNKNIKDEDRTYLLPVVPEGQSSGNKAVDELIKKLKARFARISKARVTDDSYDVKNESLEKISTSIRNLQVALNFEPLSLEAKNFQSVTADVINKYKDAPLNKPEERKNAIQELLDVINTADYYSSIDKAFLSVYKEDGLNDKNKKVLQSLRNSSSTIGEQKEELLDIARRIATQIAENEGFSNYLTTEKEVKGLISSFTEASNMPVKSIRLFSKIYTEAHSNMEIELNQRINQYGDLYLAATKESGATNPLSLILQEGKNELIPKIDPKFYESVTKAKKDKNKTNLLKAINRDQYNELAKTEIEKRIKRIDNTTYFTDEARNKRTRTNEKLKVRRALEIGRTDFDGWDNRTFAWLISKTLKTEEHPSEQYTQLKEKYPAVAKFYDYWFDFAQELKAVGYLKQQDSRLFFPFITASFLQRWAQADNKIDALKNSLTDQFTSQIEEGRTLGKIDPETGQPDRTIPAYFTRTDKDISQLSRDALRIGAAMNQAFLQFQLGKQLEDTFLLLHKVEENKGHLETNANGDVLMEGGQPVIIPENRNNAELLRKNIDDALYHLSQDNNTLVDLVTDKLSKGDEKKKEDTRLNVKKTILQSNAFTQQLAVGLKALVAIPNYIGAHIQAIINAGAYFKGREYEKNHARVIASSLSNEEKAILDMIIPLNDDIVKEKRRKIAKKESLLKWVGTWTFNDVMMSTNQLPDKAHQLTNAITWLDNTMVIDGQLVNIRQHLKKQNLGKYKLSQGERKQTEVEFEQKVTELKASSSLKNIAKFNEDGELSIPGFDIKNSNIGAYRNRILEYGRYITGQMSRENKADYRRNIIASSFMMFKNWIPKQVSLRAMDIHKNPLLDEWEYGRTRLFFKTWAHLGLSKIHRITQLTNATPEGLAIMREMLEQKKEEYLRKTGSELEISEEEFFDMVRKELRSEFKELQLLIGLIMMVVGVKLAAPDDDEDPRTLNRWKLLMRASNKVYDELFFYWNPLSAESITRGTVLPSLGILSKVTNIITHTGTEMLGQDWENRELFSEDIREKNQVIKYWMNLIPVASQFQTEMLPIISPETAKDLGIRVTAEARALR